MRKEKTVKIGDMTVTVYELTVKEIMKITESWNGEKVTTSDIDMLFPDRLPSDALPFSLRMRREEIEEFTPSEIEALLDAAEEVNPTFASLVERLADVGRKAIEARAKASGPQSAG